MSEVVRQDVFVNDPPPHPADLWEPFAAHCEVVQIEVGKDERGLRLWKPTVTCEVVWWRRRPAP